MLDERNVVLPIDRLLAAEFFDHLKKKIFAEPENRLMFAVFEDAVSCFQDNVLATDSKRKTMFADAEKWILDADTDGLFSFDNLCGIFEITPQYLRQGLMRWKQEKLSSCSGQRKIAAQQPPAWRHSRGPAKVPVEVFRSRARARGLEKKDNR